MLRSRSLWSSAARKRDVGLVVCWGRVWGGGGVWVTERCCFNAGHSFDSFGKLLHCLIAPQSYMLESSDDFNTLMSF